MQVLCDEETKAVIAVLERDNQKALEREAIQDYGAGSDGIAATYTPAFGTVDGLLSLRPSRPKRATARLPVTRALMRPITREGFMAKKYAVVHPNGTSISWHTTRAEAEKGARRWNRNQPEDWRAYVDTDDGWCTSCDRWHTPEDWTPGYSCEPGH